LLTDPRFVLEPDFDGLVLGVLGKSRRDARGKEDALGLFVGLRMPRTNREPTVAKLRQHFADRAL